MKSQKTASLEKTIAESLTKFNWRLRGIIPPAEWCPDCIHVLAIHLQQKYGRWTGKTFTKGKGKYTYLYKVLVPEMEKIGMLQFQWYQIPPFQHICKKM